MKPSNLTERTLGSMAWMMSGTGAQAALRTLVLLVLARLLTPEDFGIVAAALVVVSFSNIFAQLGVGQAIVQRSELTDRHVRTAFTLSLATGVAFTAAVWLSAPAMAAFFHMPTLEPVLRFMSVTFLLSGPAVTAQMLLQRDLRFRQLAVIDTGAFLVGFAAVGIVLAVLGFGVWSLAVANVARVVLRGIALLIVQPHPMRPLVDGRATRDLLGMGTGFTLGKLFNFLALQGDYFVVGRWMGGAALGLYSRAYELMVTPATLFGRVVDAVLFPVMAKVQGEPKRLAAGYLRGLSFVALLSMPLSAVVTLLAPELVWVLLGERWMGVVLPLQVLAVGMFFRTSYKISESVLRGTGAVYDRAWRQAIYAGLVFGGAWVGQHWGLGAVAAGVLLAITVNFALMTQSAARCAHVGARDLWAVHGPVVLLSAVVGVVAALVALPLRGAGAHPLAVLLASLAAGGGAGALLLRLAARRVLGEVGMWVMERLVGLLRKPFRAPAGRARATSRGVRP